MIHISTIARLSIGLVLLTISILFGADMIGLIPDRSKATLFERQRLCESLAVYCSVAAQNNDTSSIMTAAKILVERNEDILSAAIRRGDGTLEVAAGDHIRNWTVAPKEGSNPTHVRVPIFEENNLWGNMEITFQPIRKKGIAGIWAHTIVKLIGFVILVGFVVYRFFLKRTLRHLDPSSVVPQRVKSALDTLTEGVMILDRNERIVLANTTLSEQTGKSSSELLGRKASEIAWAVPKAEKTVQDYPWVIAQQQLERKIGVRMGLPTSSGKWLTFMVNSAPIIDGNGNCRGVITSLDDVTKIEEKNTQLKFMLKELEEAQDEVKRKNKELEILATRDPLTNCLNRRAFFELFENAFKASRRYKYELCCIMLDIDHFKKINDTHGHAAGDQVLRNLSEILRKSKRDSDVVCRYGGEEFCVLLTQTDIKGALITAERFRREIESFDFSGIKVTSSFGASSILFGPIDAQDLVGQADTALYAAKEGGRNRVVSYEHLESVADMDNIDFGALPETALIDINEAAINAVADFVRDDLIEKKDALDDKKNLEQEITECNLSNKRSKDAYDLVNRALDGSAKISRSMGLHASSDHNGEASVQLNQEGDWGDNGEIDEKETIGTSSISQAATILNNAGNKPPSRTDS